jgi:ketosteroid isomerase-like protein
MAYYQAGDYAAIPDLYTEDAVIMARGRPRMEGRASLRQSIGKLAAGRKVDIDITERELEVRGDVAWMVTDFKVQYSSAQPATQPVVEYGRSMLIFLRGPDGKWRIHRDMDTPAPAPDGAAPH